MRLGRPRVFVSEARIDALRGSGASWRAIAKELGIVGHSPQNRSGAFTGAEAIVKLAPTFRHKHFHVDHGDVQTASFAMGPVKVECIHERGCAKRLWRKGSGGPHVRVEHVGKE